MLRLRRIEKVVPLAAGILLTSFAFGIPVISCPAHHHNDSAPKQESQKQENGQVSNITQNAKIAASDKDKAASPQYKVSAKDSLMSVKELVHRIRSVTLLVINDVEQRDMVVTGEPMLLQPIPLPDDTHPIPWAQKMEDLGPAEQPKAKWINQDVGHLGDLVNSLEQEVAQAMAQSKDPENQAYWQQIGQAAQSVKAHYQTLQSLTKGPKYDNIEIGKEALWIYNNAQDLEQPWKSLVKKNLV